MLRDPDAMYVGAIARMAGVPRRDLRGDKIGVRSTAELFALYLAVPVGAAPPPSPVVVLGHPKWSLVAGATFVKPPLPRPTCCPLKGARQVRQCGSFRAVVPCRTLQGTAGWKSLRFSTA
jgi:hypothetical protein